MRDALGAVRLVGAMAFRADRRGALAVICLYAVRSIGFTTAPLWLKLLADAAGAGNVTGAVLAGAAAAAAATLTAFVGTLGVSAAQLLQERTSLLVQERLARLALGVPGIEHYEHPEYQDTMALLREERGLLAQRVHRRAQEATAEPWRAARHAFDLATSAQAGRELRTFGLEAEIVRRYRRLWGLVYRARTRAGLLGAALDALAWLVFALGYAAALALAVWLAVAGRATAGDVLLALGLAAQVNGYVGNFAYLFGWFLRTLRAVARLRWLEGYATSARAHAGAASPDPGSRSPDRLRHGIDLEGVSFRYPGNEALALSDVTLHLPAGATVALVGENGAGKTTLFKLLCGLYEPTGGRVLVDGLDLRSIGVEAWRSRVSAAFQDYSRFELPVRETVGVGDLPRVEDARAVVAALERAGAVELPGVLPAGLETQLGRDWEGGVELSGGQWQKLALARAMMRERPLLLVLDEPTASLDAQTEHELFERYADATRRGTGAPGSVALLVTQRFSTVGMADLIVVLERGRVVELGTHAELMRRSGLYAELYELQARAYR